MNFALVEHVIRAVRVILRYSEGCLSSRSEYGGDPSEYLRMTVY
jgi:hypothetical protein